MTLRAPHLSGKRFPPVNLLAFAVFASPLVLIDGTGAKPFAQTDWPNPQVQGVQQPQNLSAPVVLLTGKAPFFQTDWPNPQIQGTQEPVQTRRDPIFLETGDKPFLQTEWPNPTVAVKIQTPFQVGIPGSIFDIAGAKPFSQTDWITPPRVKIQTPFQHQKSAALESVALSPTPAVFNNPVLLPTRQFDHPQNLTILLPTPCNFDIYAALAPVATDVLVAIVRNTDVLKAIVETDDVRDTISTDPTDVSKTIIETDDVEGELC